MRNKDIVFILLLFFWICILLGVLICNMLKFPVIFGINAGGIIYFISYLIAEKYLPNFKNWSNFKL